MKTKLLLLAFLFVANAHAQHHIDKPTQFRPHRITSGMLPKHTMNGNGGRSSTQNFMIDYPGVDAAYAASIGTDVFYVNFLEFNRNYLNTDTIVGNFTHQYLNINYDSLFYDDGTGFFQTIPLPSAQLELDSLEFYFFHNNVTANGDTIHIIVYDKDSFHLNGTGTSAFISNNSLWDTTIVTNQTIPRNFEISFPDSCTRLKFFPQLIFAQGKTFGVRVEFAGDTENKFCPITSFRDDCAASEVAASSAAGLHAYYYINANTVTGNFSGINSVVFNVTTCQQWYLQNPWIYPYVSVTVQLAVAFDNDTFAFCQGGNILTAHTSGGSTPYTYRWSPTTGLSDSTSGSPVLQNIFNPVNYSVTVTDANSETVTATVFVSPDQNYCSAVDTISGYAYFDNNNNGQKDSSEGIIGNSLISVDNQFYYQTDSTGLYSLRVQETSTHTLSYPNVPYASWLTQPVLNNHTYLISPGSNQVNKNFGLHVSPDTANVRVHVLGTILPPRPGFTSTYTVLCENTMGGVFNGEVQLIYDAHQSFISATPVADNVNTTSRIISWNVLNLAGGASTSFNVQLLTTVGSTLGTILTEQAIVIPALNFKDRDSFDNISILTQTVVGSYDPNDKSVSPVGIGASHAILPNQDLSYTIRFQNTGTYLAENVSVADTFDSDLDMNTFKMITASHAYTLEKSTNKIIWHFNNIMLPDSGTNEAGSHGYINYTIKPKATVSDMALIENTAYIYFDFNSAIVTNTATNMIDFNLGVNDISSNEFGVRVYPNPFSYETNIVVNSEEKNLTFQVFDVTGRRVDEAKNISTPLYKYHTEQLSNGVYNFVLKNEKGIRARGKLFVQ